MASIRRGWRPTRTYAGDGAPNSALGPLDGTPALVVVVGLLVTLEGVFDAPSDGLIPLAVDTGQFVGLADGQRRAALAGDGPQELRRQFLAGLLVAGDGVWGFDAVEQFVAGVVDDEEGDLVGFVVEVALPVEVDCAVGEDAVGAGPRAIPAGKGQRVGPEVTLVVVAFEHAPEEIAVVDPRDAGGSAEFARDGLRGAVFDEARQRHVALDEPLDEFDVVADDVGELLAFDDEPFEFRVALDPLQQSRRVEWAVEDEQVVDDFVLFEGVVALGEIQRQCVDNDLFVAVDARGAQDAPARVAVITHPPVGLLEGRRRVVGVDRHHDCPAAVEVHVGGNGGHRRLRDVDEEAVFERRRVDCSRVEAVLGRKRRVGERDVGRRHLPLAVLAERFEHHVAVAVVQRVEKLREGTLCEFGLVCLVDGRPHFRREVGDAVHVDGVEGLCPRHWLAVFRTTEYVGKFQMCR